MDGQQGLVGRDDMLAIGNRAHHQLLGDGSAANNFDDDVDVWMVNNRKGVSYHGQTRRRLGQCACLVGIAYRHHRDFNTSASPTANFFLIAVQHIESALAYRAHAQKANSDGQRLGLFGRGNLNWIHVKFFIKAHVIWRQVWPLVW